MGIKTRIGIFLLIIGISIISWAVYVRLDTEHKEKTMIEEFNKVAEKYESGNSADSQNAVVSVNTAEVKGMIGILSIPKIDLKSAVVDGVDANSLKIALGHFKETAMPGEKGNCAISGHRSFTYNQFFNRLNEVEKGDEIDISTLSGSYRYIVYEKRITDPDDISVLDKTNEPVITLITCHPERSSSHRLIIRGKLQ